MLAKPPNRYPDSVSGLRLKMMIRIEDRTEDRTEDRAEVVGGVGIDYLEGCLYDVRSYNTLYLPPSHNLKMKKI